MNFKKKVNEINGDKLILLTEYNGYNKPIEFLCMTCNETVKLKHAGDLTRKRKYACSNCKMEHLAKLNAQRTKEKIKTKLKNFPRLNIEQIGVEVKTFVELRCQDCNHQFKVSGNHLLKKQWRGCPECWKNSDEWNQIKLEGLGKSRVQQVYNSKRSFMKYLSKRTDVKLSGTYTYMTESTEFQCTICERKWETIPSYVKSGSGCPICNMSKGEREVEMILKKHNLNFIPQWRDHDCKHILTLPYDFYLPDHHTVIEFQGIQHEKHIPFFHRTVDDFLLQQKKDQIKKNYCEKQNIGYISIWYHEFDDIETILLRYLDNRIAVGS